MLFAPHGVGEAISTDQPEEVMAGAAPHKGRCCSQKGGVGRALARELSVPATKTTRARRLPFLAGCWFLVSLLLEYINMVLSELTRASHSPIEATGPW